MDGHFRFDCVPAGDHLISRAVNYIESQMCSPMDSHTALAAVRPGQIAKVELRGHGRMVIGRIALVESELGKGSTFTVTLPVTVAS